MKKIFILLLVSTGVWLFFVTQSSAQQNTNPLDDLFDNRWRGLFLAGTVRYGITQSGLSISTDRFNEDDKFDNSNSRSMSGSVKWRLGYAVSESMGIYIASPFLSVQPAFGLLLFSQQHSNIFYTIELGYTRMAASTRITDANFNQYILTAGHTPADAWTFNLGIGNEFRQQYAFELTAGFSRITIPNAFWDSVFRNVHLNGLSLFVSFNYLLY